MSQKKVAKTPSFYNIFSFSNIEGDCHTLRDLIPSVQFKKREKHSCRLKSATLLKVTLVHGCFLRF